MPAWLHSFGETAPELDDWIPRFGVMIFYLIFGLDKFDPHSEWVAMFRQIGVGDWFRLATGAIEVAGAVLTIIPRTALYGLLLLAGTMAGAVLILAFELHRPGDAPFPGAFGVALLVIACIRWRAGRQAVARE